MKRLLSIAMFIASIMASADPEKPAWINEPVSNTKDIIVVGIGDGLNANDAQTEAKQRGWNEIVEQVLGVDGTSRTRANSTTEATKLTGESELTTGIVQFKTLITLNKYIEQLNSGEFRCYLQLKLPEKEVSRLRKLAGERGSAGLLGRVLIESDPAGAEVSIDGEPMGETPLKLLLPPKNYRIKVHLTGYKSLEREISLSVGKDFSLNLRLEKATGTLIIHTEPSDAEILIDDELVGKGGVNELIAKGSHKVEVKSAGYLSQIRYVNVRENKEHELSFSLSVEPKKNDSPNQNSSSPEKSKALSRTEWWNEQARQLVKSGRWPALAQLGQQWAREDLKSANAYFYAGYGLLKLHRSDAALEFLEHSNRLRSDSVVLQALCECNNQLRKFSAALNYCERSLLRDLNNAAAYAEIANSYEGDKQPLKAYENLMVAVSLNNAYYTNLKSLCRNVLELRRHGECAKINYPLSYR